MGIQQGPQQAAPSPRFVHPFGPWRRRAMVVVFSSMMALLSADQNLLAPNLTAAAHDFGMDSHQKDTYLGGYVMAAFFMIGAPSAVICGWLTDKVNRVYLLFAIVVVGQGPCLCTYFVTTFWQFFVLRMLTGIAVGGTFPLVFSLLGDLFPATQRAAMASLVQIATGLGIGVGQVIAGVLGPATNWRVPFVLVAAPSLLLALVMVLTTKEPPRGAFEEALKGQYAEGIAYDETISWAKAKQALRTRSNWVLILQALPGCLPWGVMQTYFNDYLSQDKGFSVQMATVVLLVFGISGGVGIVAGGTGGQLLYNWKKESMAVLSGAGVMLGVGPVYYLINADLQAAGTAATMAMAALAGFVVSVAPPNLRAAMLNVNEPETRGVALALHSVTDDLGRGLGPVVVAAFITTLGRRNAFNVAVIGWIPCGLIILCLAFFVRKDEAAVQARLAARSREAAMRREISFNEEGGSVRGGSAAAAVAAARREGGGGGQGLAERPSDDGGEIVIESHLDQQHLPLWQRLGDGGAQDASNGSQTGAGGSGGSGSGSGANGGVLKKSGSGSGGLWGLGGGILRSSGTVGGGSNGAGRGGLLGGGSGSPEYLMLPRHSPSPILTEVVSMPRYRSNTSGD